MSKAATEEEIVATGKRKTAVARVRLKWGTGKIEVNGIPFEEYCYTEQLVDIAAAPLNTVELRNSIDARIKIAGGGPTGQAGAIAHGFARAIQKLNPELRIPLKRAGHITRDPRVKERKKSGQPGARKRFQFSKR
jgi:small subunit ribosomal protein S9